MEARFQAMVEAARTRHDKKQRSMEAKLVEIEGKLNEGQSRQHLEKAAKTNTWLTKYDEQAQLKAERVVHEAKPRLLSKGSYSQPVVRSKTWLTRMVKQLMAAVSLLETDVAACAKSSVLSELEANVTTLEDDADSLDVDLSTATENLEALVSAVESEFLALESSASIDNNLEARVSTLEVDTATLDADLNATMTSFEIRLSEMDRDVIGVATLVSSVVSDIKGLEDELNATASGLADVVYEIEATSTVVSDVKARIALVEANAAVLDSNLSAVASGLSDLSTSLSAVESDVTDLSSDVAAVESYLNDLEGRISAVETHVVGFEPVVYGLRIDLDDAELTIQPFTSREDLDEVLNIYFEGNWTGYLNDVLYGHFISYFDVSLIEDFSGLFANRYTFNEPLNDWQTFSATNMEDMFNAASSFNQPLGAWSVGKVTSMQNMFKSAESFNDATIDGWDVSNCEDMDGMFLNAGSFSQNLCAWGNVLPPGATVDSMFAGTSCESKAQSNLAALPPGPFCAVCTST